MSNLPNQIAQLDFQNLQVQVQSADDLISVDSKGKALGRVTVTIDDTLARIHPPSAIQTSDVQLTIPIFNNQLFPDNTLHLLPIVQPDEVIAQGEAIPVTPHLRISASEFLELLGMDSFTLDSADSELEFSVVLDTGGTAVISTVLGAGTLAGDLHPTDPSIFDWTTGEVDLAFVSDIDPSQPVVIQHTYTDPLAVPPAPPVVTSYTWFVEYEGAKLFTGFPLSELPIFPTSVSVTAIDRFNVEYVLVDDGEGNLSQQLPEIDPALADSLDSMSVGSVNYETGEITVEFIETIKHKTDIEVSYAKLQEVIRFIPPTEQATSLRITIPIADWDRITTGVEQVVTNSERAFKYR